MTTLLKEIETFIGETGLSEHRVGIILANNGRLVPRLRDGGRVWPETEADIRGRIAAQRAKRVVSSIPSPTSRPATEAAE